MISDELRRALEKLNRGPLGAGGTPHTAHPDKSGLHYAQPQTAHGTPHTANGETAKQKRGQTGRVVRLEEIAPGRIVEVEQGACVVFERTVGSLFEDAEQVMRPFREVFLKGRHGLGEPAAGSDWERVVKTEPEGIAFLDIETLGLVGTPVFLVGMVGWERGELVIRQHFARDYSEEGAMLESARQGLGKCGCMVTFNGKTFDVPTLRDRLAAHLLEPMEVGFHFDLLHESRRRYRRVLSDCRLQTLEYHICRRRRTGDVPGELIPQVYHDFVATGEASGIRDILYHNALDLVAMVEILTFMAGGGELGWEK